MHAVTATVSSITSMGGGYSQILVYHDIRLFILSMLSLAILFMPSSLAIS